MLLSEICLMVFSRAFWKQARADRAEQPCLEKSPKQNLQDHPKIAQIRQKTNKSAALINTVKQISLAGWVQTLFCGFSGETPKWSKAAPLKGSKSTASNKHRSLECLSTAVGRSVKTGNIWEHLGMVHQPVTEKPRPMRLSTSWAQGRGPAMWFMLGSPTRLQPSLSFKMGCSFLASP